MMGPSGAKSARRDRGNTFRLREEKSTQDAIGRSHCSFLRFRRWMLLCPGSGRRGAVWTRRSKVGGFTLIQFYGLQLKLELKEYAGQADQQLVGGLMTTVLAKLTSQLLTGLG